MWIYHGENDEIRNSKNVALKPIDNFSAWKTNIGHEFKRNFFAMKKQIIGTQAFKKILKSMNKQKFYKIEKKYGHQ